jgi:two-component system CheB/CheR fusion protein
LERRVDSVQDGAHYLVRLSPYRDGDQRMRGAVVTFVDVTGITQAEDQQTVLIRELHHRTRNLLTVVRAIATLTLGKGGSLHSFNERLAALGRVQDLVSRSNDDGMDLAVLVQQELDAHGAPDGSKVEISGPPVSLGSDRVQVLALALHELATNAMKYGALKQEAGKLSVHWHVEDDAGQDPCVVLDWTESGVAMPKDAPGRGYGRHLIERALAMSLGTTSELASAPTACAAASASRSVRGRGASRPDLTIPLPRRGGGASASRTASPGRPAAAVETWVPGRQGRTAMSLGSMER